MSQPTVPHPKVSIVIPTYNRANLLDVCLGSARQSPDYCEILVVDNASTDHTPAIISAHSAADSRVRSVRNRTNIGMMPNFRLAMSEARGDYLCVLCDDDLIHPGHIEGKVAVLEACPEIGFVYCPWHMIDAAGNSQGVPRGSGMVDFPYIGQRDEFGDLIQNNHIMMNASLFRRTLYLEHGGLEDDPRLHPSYDWDMWLRFSRVTQTAYLPEPLVSVRYHDASESQAAGAANGDLARARVRIWRKYLVESDPIPVLSETTWERMHALFEQDLGFWFNHDPEKVRAFLQELQKIKSANARALEVRFRAVLSGSSVSPRINFAVEPASAVVRSASTRSRTPIIWSAPFLDYSGYADEARHFLSALDSVGQPLAAQIYYSKREAPLFPDVDELLDRVCITNMPAQAVHVSHSIPPFFTTLHNMRMNVGRTMFETDRLPAGWTDDIKRVDRLWVPSEFNRQTFAAAGVDPSRISVIPGAISVDRFQLDCSPLHIEGAKGFNFLSVFEWNYRKGWDVLLRAFAEEFDPTEDVSLVLKTTSYPERGYDLPAILQTVMRFLTTELRRSPSSVANIVLKADPLSCLQVQNLYRAADCFVLPTRGEGWGRPFMEAMAMAMPVIGTNWSGNTAFMTPETSYLLDYSIVDVPEQAWSESPAIRGHRWAEPDVAHLRKLMRHVFEHRDEAKAVGAKARKHIAENFNYRVVAERIQEEVMQYDLALSA